MERDVNGRTPIGEGEGRLNTGAERSGAVKEGFGVVMAARAGGCGVHRRHGRETRNAIKTGNRPEIMKYQERYCMQFNPRPLETARRRRGVALRILVLSGAGVLFLAVIVFLVVQYFRHHTPVTLTAKGRIALQHHNPVKALKYLQEARSRGPNAVTLMQIRHMMADAYIQTNRPSLARSYLNKCLAANPRDAGALRIYRRTYTTTVTNLARQLPSPFNGAAARKVIAACKTQLAKIHKLSPAMARQPTMLIARGILQQQYYVVYHAMRQRDKSSVRHALSAGNQLALEQARKRLSHWSKNPLPHEIRALALYRRALQLTPSRSAALHLEECDLLGRHYGAAAATAQAMLRRGAATGQIISVGQACILHDRKHVPARAQRRRQATALMEAYLAKHPNSAVVGGDLSELELQERHIAKARTLAQKILFHHKNDVKANLLLAECEMISRHPHAAHQLVTNLTNIAGQQPRVWVLLGETDEAVGHHRRARHNYRKAISLNKNYLLADQLLLASYAQAGKNQQALQVAQSLTRVEPGYLPAWREVIVHRQLKHGSTAHIRRELIQLAQDPAFPIGSRAGLARLLVALRANAAAQKLLAGLPPKVRNTPSALHAQALLEQATGHMARAGNLMRQAVASPRSPVTWRLQLAHMLIASGLPEDARRQYALAGRRAHSVSSFNRLARGYLALGMPRHALRFARRALKKKSNSIMALKVRRAALGMLGKQVKLAQNQLRHIHSASQAAGLAHLYLLEGQGANALAAANRGLKLAPRDVRLTLLKAQALAASGHAGKAGNILLKILSRNPPVWALNAVRMATAALG